MDESGRTTSGRLRAMYVTGWVLVAAFVTVVAWLGSVTAGPRTFQIAYAIGCIGYGLIAWTVWFGRQRWGGCLLACAILRLVPIAVEPSDDLYRYVWEGRIQRAGFNPYVVAPDDSRLIELRDEYWPHINHPDYTAIYPPLAQRLFRLMAAISPTLFAFKLMHVVADVLLFLLLARWLKRRGQSSDRVVLYALCPLTLSAFAVEGHLDSLMLLLLVAAGFADERKRLLSCGFLLGLATLAKLIPVLLLPWLMWRHWRAGLVMIGVIGLGYLPYIDAGSALFASLTRFGGQTDMLGLGFSVLSWLTDGGLARVVGIALIGGASLYSAWRSESLADAMYLPFAAMVLLMPVVQYWYVTWILILMPLRPRVAWLVLAGCMVFYFESGRQLAEFGTWTLPGWTIWAVYTPFVVALVVEAIVARRRATRSDAIRPAP